MVSVEALVRTKAGLAGSGKSDGDIIIVRPLGETVDKAELVALLAKPTTDPQWASKYPLLSQKDGAAEVSTKSVSEKTQWIDAKVDPDGGLSLNWGKLDLKTHAVFVIENWPTALDNGYVIPEPLIMSFPFSYEIGKQVWHTRINVDYQSALKAAQVSDIKDGSKWLKPIAGIDFNGPFVTQTHVKSSDSPIVAPPVIGGGIG